MDNEKNLNVVLQAKIPAHIGRRDSVSTTMTVLLTNAGNIQYHPNACTIPEHEHHTKAEESTSNLSSRTASSNTLQVPYFETLESRRRSLSSLHDPMTSTCLHDRRRLSAPTTTHRSSWGPIWELRKQFLPHRRRQSSEDHFFHCHQQQVKLKNSFTSQRIHGIF